MNHWQNEPNEKDLKRFLQYVLHPFAICFYLILAVYLFTYSAHAETWEYNDTVYPLVKSDMPPSVGHFYLGEVVDLDALSLAVARHETGNCALDTNFTRVNNCHGIKIMGKPASYPNCYTGGCFKNSHEHFKNIWKRLYGGVPTWEQAVRYSGNDRANYWFNNVTAFYKENTSKLEF